MFQAFALDAEMAQLEARLAAAVASDEPMLAEMAAYVVAGGGKRLRPMAAILSYRACGGGDETLDDILDIAVGLELIHNATLVHDDINDGAETRRGRAACHRAFGQNNAIVTGDFLFTQGFRISGRFDRNVVEWTAEACRKLAEGEVLQSRFLNDPVQSLEDYLLLVERKTAAFIEAGTKIGAYLAGADEAQVERMGRFGLELGIAFQMIDDVLDMVGDGETTGKEPGIDVAEGNATLPSILVLAEGGPDADRLRAILTAATRSPADVAEALQIVRRTGAAERARSMARERAARARTAIQGHLTREQCERLEQLVDLVIERDL